MKEFTPYIIVALAFLLIGFFITKSCSTEGDLQETLNNLKEQLKEEQAARESKELEITELHKANDSLAAVKQRIKKEIVYRERQIDESILKDSANAINEYRKSLADNSWLPDNSGREPLTFREIAIGSKLMAKIPRLELTINIQDSIIANKDKIIANDTFIKKSYQSSLDIKDLEVEKWKLAYDKESAWYHEDWLWFGAGVVGTVAIVFLTGLAK